MNPERPQVIVTAVVIRDNAILMTERKYPPFKGMWALPGGHLEFGEQLEAAAIRETKEETGINIEVTGFLKFDNIVTTELRKSVHAVIFHFQGVYLSGRVISASDAKNAVWISLKELSNYNLSPVDINIIKEFVNIKVRMEGSNDN